MDKKYTYKYDKESHILHKQYLGTFTIDAIIESWDKAIEQGLIPTDTMGFLLDYTDIKLDLNIGSITKVVDYFNAKPHLFGGKKVAVIANTQENVVHPMIAQSKPKSNILQIFSTQLAAENWLKS